MSDMVRGPLMAWLTLAGAGLFALAIPPVPDHGYQFFLASRVLDGARLYVDVAAADMHPPLFTWLAVGLEWFARRSGVSGLQLFPFVVVATVAACVFATTQIQSRSPILAMALAIALLPLAGPYFGQGEHLALVLALPYLTAAATEPHAPPQPSWRRVLIALLAAIGLSLKPHFALVWIGVEIYLASSRGTRSLLRLESVVIAMAFAAYLLTTALLTPEFFAFVPWMLELYPHFAPASLAHILLDVRSLLLLAGLGSAVLMRRDPEYGRLVVVLSISMLAMYLAMLLQTKGWGYHWYPVNALALVLCMLVFVRVPRASIALPVVAVAGVVLMNLQLDRTVRLLATPPTLLPEMLRVADEYADGRPVLALSQHIHVGFPLVNYAGTGWALPYAHLWMVPAIYSGGWYRREPFEYRAAGKWVELERQIFDRVWSAIENTEPALVLVERPHSNHFDMRTYFETDSRFREYFTQATVIDTVGIYVAYRAPTGAPSAVAAVHGR